MTHGEKTSLRRAQFRDFYGLIVNPNSAIVAGILYLLSTLAAIGLILLAVSVTFGEISLLSVGVVAGGLLLLFANAAGQNALR